MSSDNTLLEYSRISDISSFLKNKINDLRTITNGIVQEYYLDEIISVLTYLSNISVPGTAFQIAFPLCRQIFLDHGTKDINIVTSRRSFSDYDETLKLFPKSTPDCITSVRISVYKPMSCIKTECVKLCLELNPVIRTNFGSEPNNTLKISTSFLYVEDNPGAKQVCWWANHDFSWLFDSYKQVKVKPYQKEGLLIRGGIVIKLIYEDLGIEVEKPLNLLTPFGFLNLNARPREIIKKLDKTSPDFLVGALQAANILVPTDIYHESEVLTWQSDKLLSFFVEKWLKG